MASDTNFNAIGAAAPADTGEKTVFKILLTISFCHLLNDTIQSLMPPIYPLLQKTFHFNYWQVGRIALTSQLTASILQPLVGLYTDRRPKSSRIARLASGGQHGMAQSLFQVGGNAGSALGPLLAWAFITGQSSIAWFSLMALFAIVLLTNIGTWFRNHPVHFPKPITFDPARLASPGSAPPREVLAPKKVAFALAVLVALMFSKFFYLASLMNYYTFYLMGKFHLSIQNAQLHLFLFLAAVAAGTFIGGPVGDKIGRKYIIWCSILGILPFTLVLPYSNLYWTSILSVVIGFILASAFSAILVYAQELMPGRIGMVSGLFFGLAFGLGGIGAALLGKLADLTSINFVYHVCAFLPALGILTAFLPNLEPAKTKLLAPQKSSA